MLGSGQMTVTLVSYRGDAVHLVFDSGQSLTLPVKLEYSRFFSKGATIDEERYNALKHVSDTFLCTQKALYYLARGSKSEMQLRQYLKKKKFSDESTSETLAAMREKGYVNDADFAKRFAADFTKRKKAGVRLLKSELAKKGISRQMIDSVLKESGLDKDNEESAWMASLKKIPSIRKKENARAKLWGFLRSRGFSDDIIRKTVSRVQKEKLLENEHENEISF
jgi:regulatory protein